MSYITPKPCEKTGYRQLDYLIPHFGAERFTNFIQEFECSICNEMKDIQDHKMGPKCSTSWHKSCIEQWLQNNTTCPGCRQEDMTVDKLVANKAINSFMTSLNELTKNIDLCPDHDCNSELFCETCDKVVGVNGIVTGGHNGGKFKKTNILYSEANQKINNQKEQLKMGFLRSTSKSISLDRTLDLINKNTADYRKELENKVQDIVKQTIENTDLECKPTFDENKIKMKDICDSFQQITKELSQSKRIKDHQRYQEIRPVIGKDWFNKIENTANLIENSKKKLEESDTWNAPLDGYVQLHASIMFKPDKSKINEILKENPTEIVDKDGAGFSLQFEETQDEYAFPSTKKAVFLKFPDGYEAIHLIDVKILSEENSTDFYAHFASDKEPPTKWMLFNSPPTTEHLPTPSSSPKHLSITYDSFMKILSQSNKDSTVITVDVYKINTEEIQKKEKEKFKQELISRIQNQL